METVRDRSRLSQTALVAMEGITKRFGSLIACDSVDLHVQAGTLHAIMGENGAGKTTLMRVLYGYYQPDAGTISLNGRTVHFRSPADAIAHHIGMVSQHYSIIPELTALDNLILGAEPVRWLGVIDRRAALRRARQLAQSLEFEPNWHRPAEELSVAGRQKLEILKLLWRDAHILILDEPTAMLSPSDVEALFATLLRLKQEGRTILLVTHKLNEVLQYADWVTVMRAGRKVAETPVAAVDAEQLTRWIVGEETARSEMSVSIQRPKDFVEVLVIRDLYVRSDRGGWGIRELNLSVRAGEIVGLAGVDGNGQAELMEALAGLRPVARGTLMLGNQPFTYWTTARRLQAGIRYLFDDRFRRGMVPLWSVEENAILGFQRDPELQWLGWQRRRAIRERVRHLIERFQVKVPAPTAPILSLSGGNQQRLVIARTLYGTPRLLVAFAPTRGLDIRGTEATYRTIREMCVQGMGALILSFDLDELMEYADRIGVLSKGQVVAMFERPHFSREAIGAAMVGLTSSEPNRSD
ncbi:MAG: heme ABC transporter ATP-binding protein [Armatimonadota bacterium]